MSRNSDSRPLVVHVIYRLAVGGLENGLVNLINHMPVEAYRHAIISLTDITDFSRRIERDDVELIALDKPPGHAFRLYPRIRRLLRERRPAIVHTRNLAALEAVVPARAAGVPVCLHGEHGSALGDREGSNPKYRLIRRLYSPFVSSWVTVSRDLANYLQDAIGITGERVDQIYNGVDTRRFRPAPGRRPIPGCPFQGPGHWLVGSVGRFQDIKDQTNLARAFVRALQEAPELKSRLRLVLVGEGPLGAGIEAILAQAGVRDLAWLPGARNDVPDILRGLDCFVLPSLSEGISNAILEAMATALPVIATAVGGNGELLRHGDTGLLVPAARPDALAAAIADLARAPAEARALGQAARREAEERFSLDAMVAAYRRLYDRLLRQAGGRAAPAPPAPIPSLEPSPLTGAAESHGPNQ